MASVYAIATMDTKAAELEFVRSALEKAGVSVVTVDVGTSRPPTIVPITTPTISRDEVWRSLGTDAAIPDDRATAIRQMAAALCMFLANEAAQGRISGVIGLGGSGGTSLITTAMRALPIGMPKLMVSTVASGNVAPYVDSCDITMMYSVVDVAGLNAVSETILSNAAHAMVGMVNQPDRTRTIRQAVGMTMFGVTTPCVTAVRNQLESDGYDCLVFHATGTGGRSMEQLVASGLISAVLDITTTEVADEVVGGIFPGGPNRFEKLLAAKVPLVLSLGALDMVNFGALSTVPEKFRNRQLHVHNDQVTLMRTSIEENRQIGSFIADKLNQSIAPLRLLIPERGLSSIDIPGQPFYDPAADAALFDELDRLLKVTPDRQLIRYPFDINADQFSRALVEQFRELVSNRS